MLPSLQIIKKRWKEFLILLLLCIIGFGGWWCSSTKSNLKSDIIRLELKLSSAELNRNLLKGELDIINVDLTKLEKLNLILDDKIDASQILIDELESNPLVEYRNVYKEILPKECNAKFSWMRNKALEKYNEN